MLCQPFQQKYLITDSSVFRNQRTPQIKDYKIICLELWLQSPILCSSSSLRGASFLVQLLSRQQLHIPLQLLTQNLPQELCTHLCLQANHDAQSTLHKSVFSKSMCNKERRQQSQLCQRRYLCSSVRLQSCAMYTDCSCLV